VFNFIIRKIADHIWEKYKEGLNENLTKVIRGVVSDKTAEALDIAFNQKGYTITYNRDGDLRTLETSAIYDVIEKACSKRFSDILSESFRETISRELAFIKNEAFLNDIVERLNKKQLSK
jgi:ribosomal protein S17E